jgi:hypothetical protein
MTLFDEPNGKCRINPFDENLKEREMKTIPKKNVVFALLVLFLFFSIPTSESSGFCWTLKSIDESHRGRVPKIVDGGHWTTVTINETTADIAGGKLFRRVTKYQTTNKENKYWAAFRWEIHSLLGEEMKNTKNEIKKAIPGKVCTGDGIYIKAKGQSWGKSGGPLGSPQTILGLTGDTRGFRVETPNGKRQVTLTMPQEDYDPDSRKLNTVNEGQIEFHFFPPTYRANIVKFGFTMTGQPATWVTWTYQLEK